MPSYVLLGIAHEIASPAQGSKLSPLAEACSRVDLTAIHEILEKVGYKDDEGVANEVSDFKIFTSTSITFMIVSNILYNISCIIFNFSPPQLSFQMWTSQIQETLNCRKRGDSAFRSKDFTTAINCYSEVST